MSGESTTWSQGPPRPEPERGSESAGAASPPEARRSNPIPSQQPERPVEAATVFGTPATDAMEPVAAPAGPGDSAPGAAPETAVPSAAVRIVGRAGAPQPPGPRRKIPWLAVGLVVALLGIVAGAAPVLSGRFREMSRLDRQARALDDDITARDRARAQAHKDLMDRFTSEDFAAKYAKVRDADKAIDAAFGKWATVAGTKFKVVSSEIRACYVAADAYNVAAADYPEDLFGNGFPSRIKLSDPRTDCGVPLLKNQ
jgi:hypothetical protein